MPSEKDVIRWLKDDKRFRGAFRQAKGLPSGHADEIIRRVGMDVKNRAEFADDLGWLDGDYRFYETIDETKPNDKLADKFGEIEGAAERLTRHLGVADGRSIEDAETRIYGWLAMRALEERRQGKYADLIPTTRLVQPLDGEQLQINAGARADVQTAIRWVERLYGWLRDSREIAESEETPGW